MPKFIVKPKGDEDFYVEYSTVVDAPTRWGTRAEFATEHARLNQHTPDETFAPARFTRADENGSSSREFEETPGRNGERLRLAWFWWDDTEFSIMNGAGCPGTIPRDQLRAYCEAMTAEGDDSPTAAAMVTPWTPEDD